MNNNPDRKRILALIAAGLAIVGFTMLGLGFGFISQDWLRPNPNNPPWLLPMIGVFLLLISIICLAQVLNVPAKYINYVFYILIALAMVMANWLVFFAKGTRCNVATDGLGLWMAGYLCQAFAGSILLFVDLILLVVAATAFRTKKT